MNYIIVFLLTISFSEGAFTQVKIDWFALGDVSFEKVQDEEFGLDYDKATFGEWVKGLDGELVAISGYMIPMDAMGTSYALSRNPNSTCFFCGGAGPETVIRLWMQPDAAQRYQTDTYLTWEGVIRLSETNQHSFIYEMWEARPTQ